MALAALLALPGAAPAQDPQASPEPRPEDFAPSAEPPAAHDLFAMPAIIGGAAAHGRAGGGRRPRRRGRDRRGAERGAPTVGLLPANRAALHMLAGETEAAVACLERAVALGLDDLPRLLEEPLFAPIATDPRLADLEARTPRNAGRAGAPRRPDRPRRRQQHALEPRQRLAGGRFDPAPPPREGQVLGRQGGDAAYDRLRDLFRLGRAAGNHGDLYDNRDKGHSALPPDNHPQVTAIRYGEAARAGDVDYGLNDRILFDRVTFGNSSTALTAGPLWRSLPRYALTRPDGAGPWRLWEAYTANQIYVYPSHRDLMPEQGDLFPANTPYMIVAQGSSGSDQPFLEAVAMILAAFRPDTKARLIEERLVAPTVQFVFRRSQRSVLSREDYMSGLAHPSAFPAYEIGLARMASLANAIAPDAIPPLVRLRVLEEDIAEEGVDYFGEGLSEQLFDTPAAIGRVWRGKDYTHRMFVSAEETRDPNGRPLEIHWRLLRGDPTRVRITPRDGGKRAEIAIDWQDPRPVAEESPVLSARVDIGVFADNGVHDSAPAIISMLLPRHETRRYEAGPDGAPRIAAIDHADPAKAGTYVDPMLMARADWRDEYAYDATGRLTGWRRLRDGRADAYDAEGRRILGPTAEGRQETADVRYPLQRTLAGGLTILELRGDALDPEPSW